MSSAIAEVYFARKSCHILRPQPIPHQFDPVLYRGAESLQSYAAFEAAMNGPEPPFPIRAGEIEGYFLRGGHPAAVNLASLLEDVYKNPPRGNPFGPDFKPRFNWLKFFALIGIHLLHALRLNPAKFSKAFPGLAGYAGRIYGYIDKARLTKKQAAAIEAALLPYVTAGLFRSPPQ
jgi:hypothetical protein